MILKKGDTVEYKGINYNTGNYHGIGEIISIDSKETGGDEVNYISIRIMKELIADNLQVDGTVSICGCRKCSQINKLTEDEVLVWLI